MRASDAVAAVRANVSEYQKLLADLAAIPGISASAFPADEVRRSANAVAKTLLEHRMTGVRLIETAGHPAVFGEMIVDSALPTILIYGHHDVQPAGLDERWISPP